MGRRPEQAVAILGESRTRRTRVESSPMRSGRRLGDVGTARGPVGGVDGEQGDQDGVDVVQLAELESQRVVDVQRAHSLDR